jgi:hypothetical protein
MSSVVLLPGEQAPARCNFMARMRPASILRSPMLTRFAAKIRNERGADGGDPLRWQGRYRDWRR